jgi:hypothetical protein
MSEAVRPIDWVSDDENVPRHDAGDIHRPGRIRLLDQHRRLSLGEPADNLLATDSLNGLDRKFLVDSLKEARRLQFVLQKTFRLESL